MQNLELNKCRLTVGFQVAELGRYRLGCELVRLVRRPVLLLPVRHELAGPRRRARRRRHGRHLRDAAGERGELARSRRHGRRGHGGVQHARHGGLGDRLARQRAVACTGSNGYRDGRVEVENTSNILDYPYASLRQA